MSKKPQYDPAEIRFPDQHIVESPLVPEMERSYIEYAMSVIVGRALRQGWSPTVRPPRLGGNARMGVFATRSPFRPNGLGLSSVVLERIQWDTPEGPVLHVRGADLVSGTPIFDIKPYLAYTDSHPEAAGGFTAGLAGEKLRVACPEPLLAAVPPEQRQGLLSVLANDPRPRYQDDPQRVYGMAYGGRNVRFRVEGDVLTVLGVEERL